MHFIITNKPKQLIRNATYSVRLIARYGNGPDLLLDHPLNPRAAFTVPAYELNHARLIVFQRDGQTIRVRELFELNRPFRGNYDNHGVTAQVYRSRVFNDLSILVRLYDPAKLKKLFNRS